MKGEIGGKGGINYIIDLFPGQLNFGRSSAIQSDNGCTSLGVIKDGTKIGFGIWPGGVIDLGIRASRRITFSKWYFDVWLEPMRYTVLLDLHRMLWYLVPGWAGSFLRSLLLRCFDGIINTYISPS